MASMFGGFAGTWMPALGQTGAVQSVTPTGGGPGGFPGIFPGMGPGQSGMAGIVEFQKRMQECVKKKTCPVTYGPAPGWM